MSEALLAGCLGLAILTVGVWGLYRTRHVYLFGWGPVLFFMVTFSVVDSGNPLGTAFAAVGMVTGLLMAVVHGAKESENPLAASGPWRKLGFLAVFMGAYTLPVFLLDTSGP